MTDPRAPKDGDFAAYLEGRVKTRLEPPAPSAAPAEPPRPEEPTEEDLLEQQADREEAEELAKELAQPRDPRAMEKFYEDLERQALSSPGEDGDAGTPE
ncbi:MAG: hypothetical protein ABI919_14205 [Ramlibacter sp.]